jgi:hypothetical protein
MKIRAEWTQLVSRAGGRRAAAASEDGEAQCQDTTGRASLDPFHARPLSDTPTHIVFVELKELAPPAGEAVLGPSS